MPQQAIEVILMRRLASYLAIAPDFLVDSAGEVCCSITSQLRRCWGIVMRKRAWKCPW